MVHDNVSRGRCDAHRRLEEKNGPPRKRKKPNLPAAATPRLIAEQLAGDES